MFSISPNVAAYKNNEFVLVTGNLTFIFWKIVIDLVQEDDLEVKDIAAGILSGLDPSIKGLWCPWEIYVLYIENTQRFKL